MVKRKQERKKTDPEREHLIYLAARIMVEEALNDFGAAKRKAARRLGMAEAALPTDAEVEARLRIHQSIFCEESHRVELNDLRRKAMEMMQILQSFNPYLTGSVLDGSAGACAEIDLQIFADSSKDVEIFLINHGIDCEHRVPRNSRAEAVLALCLDDTTVNLVIYPVREERIAFKTADGKPRARVRLPEIRRLLGMA